MVSSKRYGYKVQLNHLKNNDISYFIVYQVGGKNTYQKVGRKSEGITEKKCIELRNQILSEQRHGIDLSQKSFKHLTFNKLAERYFSSLELSSQKRYEQQYQKHIKDSFGDVVIARLDDSLIDELRALKTSEGYSQASIKQYVSLCVRIINFGIKRGIIAYSPFRDIKRFKINNTRLRYLSSDEIYTLKSNVYSNPILKLFVKIALGTGARAVSILSIQKKHINIENKSITIKDFKRKNTYVGYLDDIDFDVVVQHIKKFSANSYVVSLDGAAMKYQQVYLALDIIFKQFNKGLNKDDRANRVVIHTLRHTFASHLAIAGVSIQEIQKLMNHKDIKQTLKYAKLSPDSGRGFVQELYKR
ncbi:site-specific integrase [Sulfurimonas sp.]|uniref:tyrosine-type recombinase/integrase n=1 Tax=Sulfurimonas sp. TaxID=2022749 RepID=UPI0025F8D6ED|nr:site-specific integrase [Sulfurimonas sp.]